MSGRLAVVLELQIEPFRQQHQNTLSRLISEDIVKQKLMVFSVSNT
jgi:hypothetical protein